MGAQALNLSWSSSRFSLQFTDMAPMKAMKAMKGAAQGMTATAAYSAVAETTGLQVKKNGSFKLAGALNMKLKKKPATPARKGVNPFTKEPCVFKAKPASKTVKTFAMKKLKEMVN